MGYCVVERETHSSLLEELNHCKRLFDVRDLLFQTSPPLCQVLVHVTVLSIMSDMTLGKRSRACMIHIPGRTLVLLGTLSVPPPGSGRAQETLQHLPKVPHVNAAFPADAAEVDAR